ncbi:hypothetical protein PVL29_021702 [Vitis rotundifolia]|uniref:Uncharacterized protein n=1 Tax=Vitis rotundifolia TaxID=103349 RepID=A0AA38Z0H8_VITRO|nr:hypothetical protein PVL29_021702 [Vitis rotundifolia]
MGGCASKPKDMDAPPQSLPSEAPSSPDNANGETTHVVQEEKNNGGEIREEEPLVDLSEPKPNQEAPTIETKAVETEVLVSELVEDATVDKPVEEKKVETAEPEHKEENAKAKAGAGEVTTEAVKKEQKVEEEPVGKTEGGKIKHVDDAPPPSSEDKHDAPLATK